MLNMNEKLADNMTALKDHAKLAIRELMSMREILASWTSEAFGAMLENDTEKKQILLTQINEVLAPQQFETFEEARTVMDDVVREFTENLAEFWMEFNEMSVAKLIGVPMTCNHCGHRIEETDEYCPHCGQHLGAKHQYAEPKTIAVKKCTCGRTHHSDDRYCPSCGKEAE